MKFTTAALRRAQQRIQERAMPTVIAYCRERAEHNATQMPDPTHPSGLQACVGHRARSGVCCQSARATFGQCTLHRTPPRPRMKFTDKRIWRRASICHNPVAKRSKVLASRRQLENWGSKPAAVNSNWAPRPLSVARAYAASVSYSAICACVGRPSSATLAQPSSRPPFRYSSPPTRPATPPPQPHP
jgi:hypothetical protein